MGIVTDGVNYVKWTPHSDLTVCPRVHEIINNNVFVKFDEVAVD